MQSLAERWGQKKNGGSENNLFNTIMFAHIKLPQDLNFHWNPTKLIFRDMAAILEKKMVAQNLFSTFSSCLPHQSTPRYQLSLQSDKVDIFGIWQPFWKKNGGSEFFFSIVPSYSPHQIQHVPAGIISLAIILFEILNVKVEKYEKTTLKGQLLLHHFTDRHENRTADRSCRSERPKIFRNFDIYFRFRVIKCQSWKFWKKTAKKGNNSYIVSQIVLKIAQQIALVILNSLRFLGILISAFVFELFAKNCWFTPMFYF